MTATNDARLCAEQLIALAERETGAYGQTDGALRSRVRQLVDWINERGPYCAGQANAMRGQLQRLLARRLQLALDRARFPAIADERIEHPIFVVGFPRSGTTLLHSLLAEDPAVHAPRAWHSHTPSPPPGQTPVCPGRVDLARRAVAQIIDFVPALLQLHPYWDKYEETLIEDEELFTLDFRNAYPTHLYRVPTLDIMTNVDADGAAGAFRFHRELLQHLQWNTGKRRWTCKGVGHQFHLPTLFEIYPDAVCIWPHRSPTETHASMMTIASALYDAINGGRTDWKQQARAMAEGVRAGLDHVLASDIVADPRVIHLRFADIMADPVATVRKVYAQAGLACSAEFEQRMHGWLADPANRADRYGRFPYSAEAFGLTESWLDETFARYRRRFDV